MMRLEPHLHTHTRTFEELAAQPHEPRHWISLIRDSANGALSDELDRLLNGLSASLDRLLVEHSGLTEELLAAYEQIGVVFEVSRQFPTVQHEAAVVELFVDNLQRSFAGRSVWAARRGARGVWTHTLRRPVQAEWLHKLLDCVAAEPTVRVDVPQDPAAPYAEAMAGSVFAGDDFVCAIVMTRPEGVREFRASDMGLLQSLTTFCGDLIRNHRLVRELRGMSIAMVRSLVNAVDQKDEYTSGHSLRVAFYATLLGRELKLSDAKLQMLQWSALLHDVGKIGIRDSVLKKEGKLTEEEFTHMKEHPVRSHKVVSEVPQLADALAGVLHHHERWDGKGYPAGLIGEAIPVQARIIQIADIFDALTSNRSYRSAFSWSKALAILEQEAGTTVDPELRRRFDALIRHRLENKPGAWERLVQQGNDFVQDTESDGEVHDGVES